MTGRSIMLVSNTARSFYLFRRHLILDLIAQGYRVICVAAPDADVPRVTALGAEFIPIALDRSGMNPVREVQCLWALAALLRRVQPALVITYTIKPNTYVPVLARVLRIPVLAVITGLGYAFIDQGLSAKIARTIMRVGTSFAPSIWALNADDVKTLQDHRICWADRITVIPGEGVDCEYFAAALYPFHAAPHFFMNARLLIDKGVREYADAAAIIHRDHPDTQFHLIGAVDPGNPNAIAPDEWQQLLTAGHIIYHGTTPDVRPYINNADCVVLPSYREGVPLVLLEGAAMARPLIATDVAGCRDVIRDGRNGILCRARDTQDLVRAINQFISMPASQRAAMGQAARDDVVRRFDVHIVLSLYRKLMAQILKD